MSAVKILQHCIYITTPPHATVLRPFFRDHPGEPVPEENFWTLWWKGRLGEADTTTIRLGATAPGPTSAHLHHPPYFLQAGCPSSRPTDSVKALKATSASTLVTVIIAARLYYGLLLLLLLLLLCLFLYRKCHNICMS